MITSNGMARKDSRILVVFANGESKVYKNRSEVYSSLHIDWAAMMNLLATGRAYKPKNARRKELVGLTMDYAMEEGTNGQD